MNVWFKRLTRPALCFGIASLFLFACSRSAPEISFGFMELVYYQSAGRPRECFSFFVMPNDEDGIENLDELYLYHDREQLRWLIKSEDWVRFEQEGSSWIGTRSISVPEGETLPRGQYRAVLVNKGGESSEKLFAFDAPEESRFPFPSLEISEGRYTVNSVWPSNRLVCYDGEGNYASTISLGSLSGLTAELQIPSHARTAALWAEDPEYLSSAFTDVVSLR
jgi:hypothetical protein